MVNGNPLFDIIALAHVETVVKGGVVYKGAAAGTGARHRHRRAVTLRRGRQGEWSWVRKAVRFQVFAAAAAVAIVAALVAPAGAQVVGANLAGTVLDQSRAALPGVTVTITEHRDRP